MRTITALLIFLTFSFATAEKLKLRIKDMSKIKGSKDYLATGYGIVTGLKGTGDSDESLTQHTVNNLLKNLNIDIPEADIKANNLAAVMITARIAGGSQKGEFVDCTVSTIGDAESLSGGVLMMSPVLGTDGELIGIVQGKLLVGGGSYGEKGAGGNTVVKNVPTVASLKNAMELTRDVGNNDYLRGDELSFILHDADFYSAKSMADSINSAFTGTAIADSNKVIRVKVPQSFVQKGRVIDFIAQVHELEFEADKVAKIVMNETTGTIVFGSEVKISECAITQGNIIVSVDNLLSVSQPNPSIRGLGTTAVVNNSTTDVTEEKPKVQHVPNITKVKDLVEALNKLGVTPRDMMSILSEMRNAGVLHAQLEMK